MKRKEPTNASGERKILYKNRDIVNLYTTLKQIQLAVIEQNIGTKDEPNIVKRGFSVQELAVLRRNRQKLEDMFYTYQDLTWLAEAKAKELNKEREGILKKGKKASDKETERLKEMESELNDSIAPLNDWLEEKYEGVLEFEKLKATDFPNCSFSLPGDNKIVVNFYDTFFDLAN